MNPFHVVLHSNIVETLSATGVEKFNTSQSALSTLYYPQLEKASLFPTLNTTKEFIFLYSTDHSSGSGGVAWAECDDEKLNGIIERGIIVSGYQAETPNIKSVPNDPNGQTVHVTFHTTSSDPANNGFQQTHLLTRVGGDLHDQAGWTDRGTILDPLTAEEQTYTSPHLGYMNSFFEDDGSLVGIHHTQGYNGNTLEGINKFGKSINPGNSYVWTRVTSDIDNTTWMPAGRAFHMSPPTFFKRNGIQYSIGLNVDFDYTISERKLCIAKCTNSDYIPDEFIMNFSSENGGDGAKLAGYYINPDIPDTLNIYYTTSLQTKMFHSTWDLRNLDI